MLKALFFILASTLYLTISSSCLWAQQLKLGVNPTQINKAAVLELQSWNQGLRLTRVDTNDINAVILTLSAAQKDSTDGMIVYQSKDSSIYYRSGGAWHKLVPENRVGIVSLNGDSAENQTLQVVSTDPTHTDPAFIDNANGSHSLFLPDASESKRGVVNTSDQTFKGLKTLNSGVSGISGLTFTNLTSDNSPETSQAGLIGVNAEGNVVRASIQRTSNNPIREFDNPYLISNVYDVYVSYSIKIALSSTLLNDSCGARISLKISSGNTGPWTTISQISLENSLIVGSLVSLGGYLSNTQTLSGWVPKGFYVMISTSKYGTVTITRKSSQEVTM